jgi:hypothetical protein
MEPASLCIILAKRVFICVSLDYNPQWRGWSFVEWSFFVVLLVEIVLRLYDFMFRRVDIIFEEDDVVTWKAMLRAYIFDPMNALDIFFVLLASSNFVGRLIMPSSRNC